MTNGAVEPDPIFAAMERHKSTRIAFEARCTYEDDLEKAGRADELPPNAPSDHRTPEMIAVVNASIAARQELAATSPTTLTGLLAYLQFAAEENNEDFIIFDGEEEIDTFIQSIARAARRIERPS